VAQSLDYHNFADQRTALGIPNILNVISNLPFLMVGIWGLVVTTNRSHKESFLSDTERWPYIVFFFGVALTCFGSSYYHLHPGNATLVWDRLPMTLGFMGIVSATVAERITVNAGVRLLPFLLTAGVLSVLYWSWTEAHGQGDLRPYYLVQFGSLFVVFACLVLFRPRYSRTWCLWIALGLYIAAKLLESFDKRIYSLGNLVSGHTLKHLAAAAAGYFVALMLARRTSKMIVADDDLKTEQYSVPFQN
jgi:hypothetical protein